MTHIKSYMMIIIWLLRDELQNIMMGFPGGSVVKNEPTCQCRRRRLYPWFGKILYCLRATKRVCHNYWACALESRSFSYWDHALPLLKAVCPRAHVLQQEKPPQWETVATQLVSSPSLSATRESLHAAAKTQHSQRWIFLKSILKKKIPKH